MTDDPSRYWHPFIIQNGKMLDTKEDDFVPDIYYDFGKNFIRKNKDRPFFVYYPMCLPHGTLKETYDWDFFPVPDNTSTSGKSSVPVNYNDQMHLFIEYKNQLVERLMKGLEEQGLLENTIVFITGDNGTGKYATGQTTETGTRVPMVVYWKNHTQEAYVAKDLIDFSDTEERGLPGRLIGFLMKTMNRILKKHPDQNGLPYKKNKYIPDLEPILLNK